MTSGRLGSLQKIYNVLFLFYFSDSRSSKHHSSPLHWAAAAEPTWRCTDEDRACECNLMKTSPILLIALDKSKLIRRINLWTLWMPDISWDCLESLDRQLLEFNIGNSKDPNLLLLFPLFFNENIHHFPWSLGNWTWLFDTERCEEMCYGLFWLGHEAKYYSWAKCKINGTLFQLTSWT